MKASYLRLSKKELEERVRKAKKLLSPCRVCPRKCKTLRQAQGKLGFCKVGYKPVVSSYHPHFWEERVLVGPSTPFDRAQGKGSGQVGGSGTIFFSSCNLACVYCQNYEISQLRMGEEVKVGDLAEMMTSLQKQGCENINFVSPTIWVPQILEALSLAVEDGLKLPLVYNTGGYDAVETLRLLEGVVDIYMPDIKYADNKAGLKYSLAPNYWDVVRKAAREMFRQVGDLRIKGGVAVKGLLVRHLVLPEGLAGTKNVMKFLASLSKDMYVNIMAQYHPANKAHMYPEIDRRVTKEEYLEAVEIAKKYGLHRLDKKI